MSGFGALPVDIEGGHIDFLVTSSNKCIQVSKKNTRTFFGKIAMDNLNTLNEFNRACLDSQLSFVLKANCLNAKVF